MTALGDQVKKDGITFRFSVEGAYKQYSPWGENYPSTTLALAKLDVPIDGSLDEILVTLEDETTDQAFVFRRKVAGYGATFDDSFDVVYDSDAPLVTSENIDPILATKDINTLDGISSNSAAIEAAIVLALGNTVILDGIDNATLLAALLQAHDQNEDTGTTQSSFVIDSDGTNPATLDAQNLSAPTNFDLEEIGSNLDDADEFFPVRQKTISQVRGSSAGGDGFDITNIGGTNEPFFLIYDAINFIWLGGIYMMQDGGTPIATSPVLGSLHVFKDVFWECIDATNEIFKESDRRPVTTHTAAASLTANQMIGGQTHSNAGAGSSVTLTATTEKEGNHINLTKSDSDPFIFRNSSPAIVHQNTTGETNVGVELVFSNGVWVKIGQSGTWT